MGIGIRLLSLKMVIPITTSNCALSKDIAKPLSFALKDSGGKLSASFNINRLVYPSGLGSDPVAGSVSKTTSISMVI